MNAQDLAEQRVEKDQDPKKLLLDAVRTFHGLGKDEKRAREAARKAEENMQSIAEKTRVVKERIERLRIRCVRKGGNATVLVKNTSYFLRFDSTIEATEITAGLGGASDGA